MNPVRIAALACTGLLALTACGSGSDDSADPGATTPTGPSASATGPTASAGSGSGHSCLTEHDWSLKIPMLANQMGGYMTSKIHKHVSAGGTGFQKIRFSKSGQVTTDTDMSFKVTVPMDSNLTMKMVQKHSGPASGQWEWAPGNKVVFHGWSNSHYKVTTEVSINGRAAPTSSFDVPSASISDGMTMNVDCGGGIMVSKVAGSPFSQTWAQTD